MTEKTIQILTEQMENLLQIIYQEYLNTILNLSGSLKDIECGTHIKIPIPAGYVSCYKSEDALKVSCWISDTVSQKLSDADTQELITKSTQL